jgi:hypothetical protein
VRFAGVALILHWRQSRMSRTRSSRNHADLGSDDALTTTPDIRAGWTDAQIDRWADLIAEGRGEIPSDLAPTYRDRLVLAARRRLRDRLVQHIARAIAARLGRDDGRSREKGSHA